MTPFRTDDYHWHLPGWPGEYDSEESAAYACQFGHEVLERLQASVNPGGVIGLGMLQRAWDGDLPETWEQRLTREAAELEHARQCERCSRKQIGLSNIEGVRLCSVCVARHFGARPTDCAYPRCSRKGVGGRCRKHLSYQPDPPRVERKPASLEKPGKLTVSLRNVTEGVDVSRAVFSGDGELLEESFVPGSTTIEGVRLKVSSRDMPKRMTLDRPIRVAK